MLNLACFAVFFAAFFGWGYIVTGPEGRAAWRPAVGVACCAVAATLSYEWGVPERVAAVLVFGVGAAGALLWALRSRGLSVGSCLIVLAVADLLVAPMVIGGAQFALFQANINDQFNYLACAVIRTTESHQAVVAAGTSDYLANALLPTAHTMAGARPAVVDLYGTVEGLFPGNLHRGHYGFLCALALCTFFAVGEYACALAGCSVRRGQLLAAAYVLGFWGQLQLDLDAWSWVAATPLVAAMVGMIMRSLEPPVAGRSGWPLRIGLGLCAGGLFHLYPEMLAFLAPGLVAAVLLAAFARRGDLTARVNLLWAAGFALLLVLPKVGALWRFTAHQVSFSSKADFSTLDWMWQAVTGGPASGATGGLRWLAGSAGLSLMLENPATTAVAMLLVLFLIAGAVRFLLQPRPSRLAAGVAASIVAVLAVQLLFCVAVGYRWIAAKGVSYGSVIALPLLLAPAAADGLGIRNVAAWVLLGFQLVLGLFRPLGARDPDGIHYRFASYPAVMDPALKTARTWGVGEGPQLLRQARRVKIDVPDVWLETYASICVQSEGRPYFKGLPVYIYIGIADASYGTQPKGPYDGLVYMDYDRRRQRAGLGFALEDGRIYSARPGPTISAIHSGGPLATANGLLSWQMLPGGVTHLAIGGAEPGKTTLELGLFAPAAARGALTLVVETPGGTRTRVPVAGLGAGELQGFQVPLAVPGGSSDVTLTLESRGTAMPGLAVTLVNPRLY